MDRLLRLSGYRLLLRSARLGSPDAVLSATSEQRRQLREHAGEIRRLVQAGNPDVMRALFVSGELDWHVATVGTDSAERLLSASRGKASLVSLLYRVDGGGESERRAWAKLKQALALAGP